MERKRIVTRNVPMALLTAILCMAVFLACSLRARAEGETVSFDAETGMLTLKAGNVVADDVRAYANNPDVKIVYAEKGAVLPERCTQLFKEFTAVKSIDLQKADTSNVIAMNGMFHDCAALEEINLYGIDVSKVTAFSVMFSGCSSLKNINLSTWHTDSATNFQAMFNNCTSLEYVTFGRDFDTSKVTNMGYMFAKCESLVELNLTGFDTSSVDTIWYMFDGCTKLRKIEVSGMWTMEGLRSTRDGQYAFRDCVSLVGGNGTTYDAQKIGGEYAHADVAGNPGYLTKTSTAVLIGNILYLYGYVDYDDVRAFENNQNVMAIYATGNAVLPKDCQYLFSGFRKGDSGDPKYFLDVKDVDLTLADSHKVTDMGWMFRGLNSVEKINMSGMDVSNVTIMQGMFIGNPKLTSLSMGGWDTSNVTNFGRMFYKSSALDYLDLSGFNVSGAKNLLGLFEGCTGLSEVNISGWDISKVTSIDYLFKDCVNLRKIKMDGIVIPNYLKQYGHTKVFLNCNDLQVISWLDGSGDIYESMMLPNAVGWTTDKIHNGCVSGNGEYAVIQNAGGNILTNRAELDMVEAFPITITMDEAPTPGIKFSKLTYFVKEENPPYKIDKDASGWINVATGEMMDPNERVQCGAHYVFKLRIYLKDEDEYFINVVDSSTDSFPDSKVVLKANGNELVEFVSYAINDDGTLDWYGVLYRTQAGSAYTTGSFSESKSYTIPNDQIMNHPQYKYAAYAQHGQIPAANTPKFSITKYSTKITYKSPIMTAGYCDYMGIPSENYEISFDGAKFVPLSSFNGIGFHGLFPGTMHTITLRVIGKKESFVTYEVETIYADTPIEGLYIVYFDANDGSEDELPAYAPMNEALVLPENGFDNGYYYTFAGWDVDGTIYQPGESITPREGLHILATWNKPGTMWSVSAAFKGMIELNFYCEIPDSLASDSKAYVTMTKDGGTTKKVLVKDGTSVTISGHATRRFAYPVVAKELRDDVVFRLFDGKGNEIPLVSASGIYYGLNGCPMSIVGYCDKVLANSDDEKMIELAKSVKDYGTAAQLYFGYKADGLSVSNRVKNLNQQLILDNYGPVKTGTAPAGFQGFNMTLVLEANTSCRVYYLYDEGVGAGRFSYTVDDKSATMIKTSAGKCYLEVAGIAAKDLDKVHKFTISGGGKTQKLKVSAMTYAWALITNNPTKNKPCNLAKAMYLYNQAAKNYFGK